ncbi:MAG TPA: serine/threonine-protein kinase [Polyangiaceae bacterium]|nr:serine/threonine-protein kinase [Polyangiaceae bacterium]
MADTLQNGRYVLLGPLGQGTQGHTFDGVDKREGRAVAIKCFDVRTAHAWKDAELAEREARVLQVLSHDRLPRYVDHFEEDGRLYLVMEKIDGESLASLRKRGACATENDVVRLLRDASDVLDYLHVRTPPIVHRDIKPGNVLRRPDGSFAFVDFGAVRDKLRPEGGSTVIGTFGYMAPEQFQGRALPASDVYAVAATALAFVTGQEPENLPHRGLAIDVRAALEGRTSARLARVLERMLDPDPDKRAARIAPLLVELERGGAETPRMQGEARAVVSDAWETVAREFERRADELERLASSGGAGSEGWRRGAEGWRKGADKWRKVARKIARGRARRAEKHARDVWRSTLRGARRDGAEEGRDWVRADFGRRERVASPGRVDGSGAVPWPVRLALAIAFSVAIVAVSVATQVVVPLLLTVLSWFLAARGLGAARSRVRDAGRSALDTIARAQRSLGGEAQVDGSERDESNAARNPPPQVRVEAPREALNESDAAVEDDDSGDASKSESSGDEARMKRGPL